MGDLSRDFSVSEFKCKCGCGAFAKRDALISKLQELRDKVKMPITVTSGTRCNSHNREVGGVDTSDHLDGMAADIRCDDMRLLLRHCLNLFPRVGIGPGRKFIHVDVNSKKEAMYWTYDSKYKRIG